MDLRPYQQTLVSTTKTKFRNGEHSVLVVLGCGGGKSVIAAKIAKQTTDKNHDVIFIVHRRELCEQIRKTFNLCGVNPERCRIEMVQTLCRRSFPQPKLLIIDEAHHVMAESYQKVLDKCKGSYVIGFTATPERLDGKSLKDVFGTEIKGPTVQWLIDHKFLSDYTAYNAPLLSTEGMHIRHGDYVKDDIDAAMSTKLFGDAVNNWKRIANGKKTIVYCHSVEASKQIAEAYRAQGISAAHLDGTTPKKERESIVQAFRDGTIEVLSNVDLFGEGFDVPDCECVQLLRPTASRTVFVQQAMRSMRYQEGKHAIILDHTENIAKFGTPKNLAPVVERKKQQKKKNDLPVKYCPECLAVIESGQTVCPYCGYELPRDERKSPELVECSLKEVEERSVMIPQTFADIVNIQKRAGYKFAWCIYKAREWKIQIPSKYRFYARRILGY